MFVKLFFWRDMWLSSVTQRIKIKNKTSVLDDRYPYYWKNIALQTDWLDILKGCL